MIQGPAAEGLGASVNFLNILVCRASGFRLQDFGPRSNSWRRGCLVKHAYTALYLNSGECISGFEPV